MYGHNDLVGHEGHAGHAGALQKRVLSLAASLADATEGRAADGRPVPNVLVAALGRFDEERRSLAVGPTARLSDPRLAWRPTDAMPDSGSETTDRARAHLRRDGAR